MVKKRWIILLAGLLIFALVGGCLWYFITHRPESDRLPLHTSIKMTQLARKYAEEKYGGQAKGCKTECSYRDGVYEVNFKKVYNGFIVADLFDVHLEKDGTPVREVGRDPGWHADFDPALLKKVSKKTLRSWAEDALQKKVRAGEILDYKLEDRFMLRKEDGQYGILLTYQYKSGEERPEGVPEFWGFLNSLYYPLG